MSNNTLKQNRSRMGDNNDGCGLGFILGDIFTSGEAFKLKFKKKAFYERKLRYMVLHLLYRITELKQSDFIIYHL
jgi:hypothetical protein